MDTVITTRTPKVPKRIILDMSEEDAKILLAIVGHTTPEFVSEGIKADYYLVEDDEIRERSAPENSNWTYKFYTLLGETIEKL